MFCKHIDLGGNEEVFMEQVKSQSDKSQMMSAMASMEGKGMGIKLSASASYVVSTKQNRSKSNIYCFDRIEKGE